VTDTAVPALTTRVFVNQRQLADVAWRAGGAPATPPPSAGPPWSAAAGSRAGTSFRVPTGEAGR